MDVIKKSLNKEQFKQELTKYFEDYFNKQVLPNIPNCDPDEAKDIFLHAAKLGWNQATTYLVNSLKKTHKTNTPKKTLN